MLYTRKGDEGSSKLFGCNEGLKKDSDVFEVLGTLDELNSFLGICKVKIGNFELDDDVFISEITEDVQQALFTIQANTAGAEKRFFAEKTASMEKIIDKIEKLLPPIKNFCISGGSELSAYLDYARTIARRTERGFVGIYKERNIYENKEISAYLNRLSSLLYALSRFANLKSGIKEVNPTYK